MEGSYLNRKIAHRSGLLDSLRGWTVINMILFHALWDFYYLSDVKSGWLYGKTAFLWQQTICCTFIVLSGFCSAMGRQTLRRGLTVFLLGAGVTAVTVISMPNAAIWFGVLTMIGSGMILTGWAKPFLLKIPAKAGLCICLLLFVFTRGVNQGYIGILFWEWLELPGWLYRDYVTTYFGFPFRGFYSSDYFSLIPWLFLFWCGFYAYGIWGQKVLAVKWQGISVLNVIGRHALVIYVLHQPVVYGLMVLVEKVVG